MTPNMEIPAEKINGLIADLLIETLIESRLANAYLLTVLRNQNGWSDEKIKEDFKTHYNQQKIRLLTEIEKSLGHGFDPDLVIKDILRE